MEKINWGIIGCGDVTEIKSGPAFNKVDNSKLVAVMRRDAAKAADYAARHNVPKWYNNANELINDSDVNAIYIATPPLYHEAYTIAAMQAGKPVYVEKPMTLNAASAIRMKKEADETGVKLSVAHYRREWPLFKKIKTLLKEGIIGEVKMVNLQFLQPAPITTIEDNWRLDPAISGGGLFHDLAPHQLDLMVYFFGNAIRAEGIALNQAKLYEADDMVTGFIQFDHNILFNGTWCFTVVAADAIDQCIVRGSKGSMTFGIFSNENLVVNMEGHHEVYKFDIMPHVQQPMIAQVVQYFLGKAPNPCPPEDGIEVMRIMDAFTSDN